MKILGLSLVDEGFKACLLHREASADGLQFRNLHAEIGEPAFAFGDIDGLLFGIEAEHQLYLQPRRTLSTFWEELSLESSNLAVRGRSPSFSELAYHFFRLFLDRLKKEENGFEKVVLAVPGTFLENSRSGETRLGLILGICQDLQVPVCGVADMACASLLTQIGTISRKASFYLHVDVHLHSTHLTLLELGETIRQRSHVRIPRMGLQEIYQRVQESLGNQFLHETSFDISEDRRIEQAFYREVKDIMASLEFAPQSPLQISTRQRSRQIIVTRDRLEAELSSFWETISHTARKLAEENLSGLEGGLSNVHVGLSGRTSRLHGLRQRLAQTGFREIVLLKDYATARGAAILGVQQPLPGSMEEVAVITEIPRSSIPSELQVGETVQPTLHRQGDPEATRPPATHLLFEGVAHPLHPKPFRIGGTFSPQPVHFPVPEQQTGRLDTFCEVQFPGEKPILYFMAQRNGKSVEIASPVALQAGDRLELPGAKGAVFLEFIHCQCP